MDFSKHLKSEIDYSGLSYSSGGSGGGGYSVAKADISGLLNAPNAAVV